MMEWYCEYHRFHFQNLVFTFRGSRLIPSSTPLSLDFPARSVIDIYEINTYKYIKQQETLARSKKLAELDKYAKDAELLQAMQDKQEARARSQGQGQGQDQDGVGNNTKQGGHDEPVEVEDDEAEVEYLHIKLRGKDTTDEKIRVKKTTTVFAILSHYKRIKKISADTPVKLEFDDEAIDPSMAVGETEIEDDDMLDVRVG
ncbi:ubiquitin-2 like Rad60 SUMO-like-domain-containing protein [Gamsiella multidivaricata]|uniref:ubiquitin-2 like Rad60 SUMO-like-domain-containing protein n=1 Tax=Gamsiella multidivaricata TaxID=101098 RepID=UPI002220F6C6|nr:ubiquitin-2 like Rad60 SUMO-like-domain-containing protein [Gamsiella multidivaricata]KAI7830584.1 ubiquitin-2 like Rad60 SUMO-like-domain-containing protein [Gamsiella multidivaricata]